MCVKAACACSAALLADEAATLAVVLTALEAVAAACLTAGTAALAVLAAACLAAGTAACAADCNTCLSSLCSSNSNAQFLCYPQPDASIATHASTLMSCHYIWKLIDRHTYYQNTHLRLPFDDRLADLACHHLLGRGNLVRLLARLVQGPSFATLAGFDAFGNPCQVCSSQE